MSGNGGGWAVFGLLAWFAVIAWFVLPERWTNTYWYAVKYGVFPVDVTIADKPGDCDWTRSPLGNKGCHYAAMGTASFGLDGAGGFNVAVVPPSFLPPMSKDRQAMAIATLVGSPSACAGSVGIRSVAAVPPNDIARWHDQRGFAARIRAVEPS
jgi:hypothetical protein